jgi:hypothetical protein
MGLGIANGKSSPLVVVSFLKGAAQGIYLGFRESNLTIWNADYIAARNSPDLPFENTAVFQKQES